MIELPAQEWRRSVDDYRRLTSFTFGDERDFERALSAFNEEGGALNDAPFDIVLDYTVVVPVEAVDLWSEWLRDHKIPFAPPRPVRESRELPAEEIAALRKRNYSPSI